MKSLLEQLSCYVALKKRAGISNPVKTFLGSFSNIFFPLGCLGHGFVNLVCGFEGVFNQIKFLKEIFVHCAWIVEQNDSLTSSVLLVN